MEIGKGTETGVTTALARSLEARVMRCRWFLVMNKEVFAPAHDCSSQSVTRDFEFANWFEPDRGHH
jgi:hypothetical protein